LASFTPTGKQGTAFLAPALITLFAVVMTGNNHQFYSGSSFLIGLFQTMRTEIAHGPLQQQ
jgi:hypothetical protein